MASRAATRLLRRRPAPFPGSPRFGRAGVVAGLVVAALAVVASVVVLTTGGGADRDSSRAAPPRGPEVVRTGGLAVTVPTGWRREPREPRIPGVRFTDPIVLVEEASGARLVAGLLPATSRTLLPSAFAHAMATDLPRPETVEIGEDLQARHYAGLTSADGADVLDAYAAPTTEGVATVVCLAGAASSLLNDCWSAVSRIKLERGSSLSPDAAAAFRVGLRASVEALDRSDSAARRALSRSTTTEAQAQAVAPLPGAYRGAAATLAPLVPARQGVAPDIVAALRRAGTGYKRLEQSIRRADREAYEAARSAAVARRATLQRLLTLPSPPKP
jgi:hypothetical protein